MAGQISVEMPGQFSVEINSLSAGAIIACSVAAARALAPIDLAIGNWKNVVSARNAFKRLLDTMVALADLPQPMELPTPTSSLKIEKITVAAPASGKVLLSEVSFELQAGQGLGVIGPSAGGKTTLVRAITGIWTPLRGSVRLDDADLQQYSEEMLGKNIGYLPQEVALLDATIEENISRFAPDPNPESIVAAAKAAGVHEMIVRLDDGYRTQIGPQGAALSAGQRQRIGLARALYGNPFLVVLDEPNSNLDGEGEIALSAAIMGVRERGGIVVVVAHRPSALANIDLVAVMQNGRIANFGPKETVIAPPKVDPVVKKPKVSMPVVTQLKPVNFKWSTSGSM